ncbi:MAG TPA: DinB family protein [Ilumatobacteraceae bacterium]|nr:DinB family protein [Ilumatobacteraceae bacterium]HRB05158.1 DinB family protein [Ilumatobacteraceae bacterium]
MTELHTLPSVTADERTTLTEFLDYFRSVLLRKADGLDEIQARQQVGVSQMDMLGLIRHMAGVEQSWFSQAFAGNDEPEVWPSDDDPDADWHHGPDDTLAVAVAAMYAQIAKARAVVAAAESLDQVTAVDVGPPDNPARFGPRSLRWILVHLIEEYARHCGHADIIRENIDGAVDD